MKNDEFPEAYDFLKEEDTKIDKYTAKTFRVWGIVASVLLGISVGIEIFWPLPK